MRATNEGIEVNRAELAALLGFTSEDAKYSVVHLRVNGSGKLIAAASDGKRAVECRAQAEGATSGEWAVDRQFVEACKRLCDEGDTDIVFKIGDKGIRGAMLRSIASGEERQHLPCRAVTATQVTMDSLHELFKDEDRQLEGSWFAVNAFQLQDLANIGKAAGKCPVSVFPSKDPQGNWAIQATSERGTWRAVLSTVPVVAPGDQAEKDEQETAPGAETQPATPGPLKLAPTLATDKRARKPKASKAAKKAKRKR